MFSKTKIAVDIGSSNIKILVGEKNKLKQYGLISTPLNSFVDSRILNTGAIVNVLEEFLKKNTIKSRSISFTIHGQDVIARHIKIPVMDKKALRSSVQWEIGQYLPQNGENYYIDFQIMDKVNNGDKKVFNLLVVAVPKEKVDMYIEISEKLKLDIDSIDISSNCIARVFQDYFKKSRSSESVGIIDMGSSCSNLIILDNGRLFMEKEVGSGLRNAINELSRTLSMDYDHAHEYFKANFDFSHIDNNKESDVKIKDFYDNIFFIFDKTIQFYTSGKTKKSLDMLYIIGGGSEINGLTDYLKNYFSANVQYVNSVKDLNPKFSITNSFESRLFINALGLLIRKE